MMLAAFEIHASDLDASARFYSETLGWKITEQFFGDIRYFRVETEDGEPVGRLINRMPPGPQQGAPVMGAVITAKVDNIDKVCEAAKANGAVTAMEKFPIPGEGWQAYFLDPDHNVFGIFQSDPEAA